jgi:predicted lipoprotein with Yx(FWY)xxD motif
MVGPPGAPTPDHEEAQDMTRTDTPRTATWRRTLGRAGATALLAAGLATAVAPNIAAAATSSATATTIETAKNSKLGTILVSGTTVYALKSAKAACTATCQKTWKPVVLPSGMSAAAAGNGVDASKLGTKALAEGELQITYGGKPLYWSAKDKSAGSVKGASSDKWGKWAPVVTKASSGGSSTTNAGTGGASF